VRDERGGLLVEAERDPGLPHLAPEPPDEHDCPQKLPPTKTRRPLKGKPWREHRVECEPQQEATEVDQGRRDRKSTRVVGLAATLYDPRKAPGAYDVTGAPASKATVAPSLESFSSKFS
jgi:hypothetical protein